MWLCEFIDSFHLVLFIPLNKKLKNCLGSYCSTVPVVLLLDPLPVIVCIYHHLILLISMQISTVVLKVDLECERCYKKIRRVLCKIQGTVLYSPPSSPFTSAITYAACQGQGLSRCPVTLADAWAQYDHMAWWLHEHPPALVVGLPCHLVLQLTTVFVRTIIWHDEAWLIVIDRGCV